MYKFDRDMAVSELVNQEIIQICFGVHDIILHFQNGQRISVFSKTTFYESNGWDILSGNTNMLSIVGQDVSGFHVNESTAIMKLASGAVICFKYSDLDIESFSFSLRSGEYVI